MTTKVVNLKIEDFDRYIGRAGRGWSGYFGNPFPPAAGDAPLAAIDKFRAYFLRRVENDPEFRAKVLELRGLRLGCFCKPGHCHGDVIAEWIEGRR